VTTAQYRQLILDTLQGNTEEQRQIPRDRLDWDGPGAFLSLYRATSGLERTRMIRAIGQIIHDHSTVAPVMAQLVDIASSLDLAELEPEVRSLKQQAAGRKEPIRSAVANYLAYRELAHDNIPPMPRRARRRVG
jgi:hypothetical protein